MSTGYYKRRVHFEAARLMVTDSTSILLRPMEITCLILGIGNLSSGSFIVCNSHPKMSINLPTRDLTSEKPSLGAPRADPAIRLRQNYYSQTVYSVGR